MKKVIGVNTDKEALYLMDYADEIYFGLRSIKNHRIWYDYLNSDIDEAIKIIKLAKDKNKKSYIAANESYSQREKESTIKTIKTLLFNGFDGIILLAKKYEKDIFKFAQKIIQTPSFSTKEEELIKLVKREMESAAFYMHLTR
jgi:hypothetical protein